MCSSSFHLASLEFYRNSVRDELGAAIIAQETAAAGDPTKSQTDIDVASFTDVHVASSCLQKALRRGERRFALAAALMLLRNDPARLWRRLTVCVFEDFSLVDLSVTARVVAVAGSKGFRLVHGEARVLDHLIGLLCALPKDRRLDDLSALGDAAFADRTSLKALEHGSLAGIVAPLVHEASRLVATCERAVPRRSFRSVSNEACGRALARMAQDGLVDDGLFELCAQGVRLSHCLLPLLVPLAIAATDASGGLGDVRNHDLAPVPLIGGVPAFAFDGFTRSGRAVLAELGRREPRLARFVAHLPFGARLDVLHHLLFFAEGGRTTPLLSDALSEELSLAAIAVGARLPRATALEAVALMVELLPTIHELRDAMVPRASFTGELL